MKLEHFLTPYTKINSKQVKDLNVRPETIKLLRGEHRMLNDINQDKILYDPPPRVMELKTKVNNWDLIWSHHFMGNRWGNSGNSVRLYFGGLQNHCRW